MKRAHKTIRLVALLLLAVCGFAACNEEPGLPAETGVAPRFPIAMVAQPAPYGRFVYVAGANFDRKYRAGVLRVIDTATDRWLQNADGTPLGLEIPGYAGGMALQPRPLPAAGTATSLAEAASSVARIFTTARDDDSVTIIDIGGSSTPTLDCGIRTSLGVCNENHRIGDMGIDAVGADPIAVSVASAPNGHVRLHTIATTDGRLAVFDLNPALGLGQAVTWTALDAASLNAGLADIVTSPLTGRTYVSDSRSNQIRAYTMQPSGIADKPWKIVQDPAIVLPAGASRDYGRGMALSSDASKLYLAYRSPTALLVVDIAPGPTGVPHHVVEDIIPLGEKPGQIVVTPTGPQGRDWLYISCFGEESVWVIDPQTRQTVKVIKMQLQFHDTLWLGEPYGMTAAFVPKKGWTLYVGLFAMATGQENKVVVVPLFGPQRHVPTHLVEPQP